MKDIEEGFELILHNPQGMAPCWERKRFSFSGGHLLNKGKLSVPFKIIK